MNEYERTGFGTTDGPNGIQNPFANAGPAAVQGMSNAMLRSNMELMSLASRRLRANMDLPRQLGACKTAVDLGQLQMQYWQSLWQDYTQYGQRLTSLWATCMQPMTNGAEQGNGVNPMGAFVEAMTRPFSQAMDDSRTAAESGAAPWEWWRTDLKAIKPRRNGMAGDHDHSESSARS